MRDKLAWEVYWHIRESNPVDSGFPLEAALRLHTILGGTEGPRPLLTLFEAMDRAFMVYRFEHRKESPSA